MEQPLEIFVLGAGASYVHGAPLTNEILPYALTQTELGDDPRLKLVRAFLRDIFHFDPETPDTPWRSCPGLVDVLSIVDMALDRKENLARGYDQEKLRRVRHGLEFAIFKALDHSLAYSTQPIARRSTATRSLAKKLNPAHTAIISFNYDVIVDIALSREYHDDMNAADVQRLAEVEQLGIDYGLEFANLRKSESGTNPFTLLKLHGSFNWLWSPINGNIYFGGLQKAVGVLYDTEVSQRAQSLRNFYEEREIAISPDREELEPIMITPTHLKDLRNFHLAALWRKAEQALRRAKKITFIGYSLPGDDLHIKYLFKRAIETRDLSELPDIIVVDYAEGNEVTPVQQNYQQFFGKAMTEYYRKGFEEYVRMLTASSSQGGAL